MEFFSAPYVEQHHVRSACGQTTLAAKLALSSSEVVEGEEMEEEENTCCKISSELADTAADWEILSDGDEEDAKDLHC